jgi:E3 ubiquitin-protein ligase Topors
MNSQAEPESSSPPAKRIRLGSESAEEAILNDQTAILEPENDEDETQCSICLQSIVDQTLIPTCSHEFCFECIRLWSGKQIFKKCMTS